MDRTEQRLERINDEMRVELKAKRLKKESDMALEQAYFQLIKKKVEAL